MRCENSSLSSSVVADPSLLRVNVILARSIDYDGVVTHSVEAFIRDEADKPVANDRILVKINGQALTLNNGSSNYYGAYPHYQLRDSTLSVEANTAYVFTVVMTDGQEHRLGTIQTLPAVTPALFSPPTHHSRRKPLRLTWHNLEPHNWFVSQWKRWQGETSATTLKIAKVNRIKDLWNNLSNEDGSANKADYLAIPIGAGEGAYTVPQSYFDGPLKRFNALELQIDSEKNQIANKPFREGSVISSVTSTLYRIEVTD